MTRMDWGQSFISKVSSIDHASDVNTDIFTRQMGARYLTIKSGSQLLWWLFAVKAAEKLSIFLYHLYWILIQTYHSSRDVVSFSKLHCSMNKLFFQFSFFWPGTLFHMSSSHNIFFLLSIAECGHEHEPGMLNCWMWYCDAVRHCPNINPLSSHTAAT